MTPVDWYLSIGINLACSGRFDALVINKNRKLNKMSDNKKWPVAGMAGMASPVVVTKKTGTRFDIIEEDLQRMLDEVDATMKKYGFEIDRISNDYYLCAMEEKAKAVDCLKKVLHL